MISSLQILVTILLITVSEATYSWGAKKGGESYKDSKSYSGSGGGSVSISSSGVSYNKKGDYGSYTLPNRGKGYQKKPQKCYKGTIKMFFGSPHDIPYGYQICDGSNSTPDLRDRFVVGSGKKFEFGVKGGASSIYLDIDQLPAHKHGISADDIYVSKNGEHEHYAEGNILNNGDHFHGPGTLKTDISGSHIHGFKVETNEGAHGHDFKLKADESGEHLHGVNIDSMVDGEHVHSDDFKVEEEGSEHIHDIKVDVVEVDGHCHNVDIDNFDVNTNDHKHGFGTIGVDDHLFTHKHKISDANTDKEFDHIHNIMVETEIAGNHKHEFEGDIKKEGVHNHDAGKLYTDVAGDHYHVVDEQYTSKNGAHDDHRFDAFFEEDYDTKREDFGVALDKIDIDKSYPIHVTIDGDHKHKIDQHQTSNNGEHKHDILGKTDEDGIHSHDINGTIIKNGDHYHDINADTEAAGKHHHKVSGYTDDFEIHLDHKVSGYTDYDGAEIITITDVTGKTDGGGAHKHPAMAIIDPADGCHHHELSGDIKPSGNHTHNVNGETDVDGLHIHNIIGKIGGDDGLHYHLVEGKTIVDGEHDHYVNDGYTDNAGDHNHDIEISIDENGKHDHKVYGETAKIGNGSPIHILPPFYSVFYICCTGKENNEYGDIYDYGYGEKYDPKDLYDDQYKGKYDGRYDNKKYTDYDYDNKYHPEYDSDYDSNNKYEPDYDSNKKGKYDLDYDSDDKYDSNYDSNKKGYDNKYTSSD